VYPDPRIADMVTGEFIPVRFHVKENPEGFGRFGAQWTPTIIILDPDGKERHRIEGFLPAESFAAQLKLGLARSAFERSDFASAAKLYDEVAGSGDPEAAPEGVYWSGVARYKSTDDPSHLGATHKTLSEKYANSSWAKRASVWG
jgi:hypothetical protein